jgi:hypothetical protein
MDTTCQGTVSTLSRFRLYVIQPAGRADTRSSLCYQNLDNSLQPVQHPIGFRSPVPDEFGALNCRAGKVCHPLHLANHEMTHGLGPVSDVLAMDIFQRGVNWQSRNETRYGTGTLRWDAVSSRETQAG